MKSILLPVDQNEQMPATLETARLLADLFEATIEGVALRPAFADIVAPDPIVAVTIPPADWDEAAFTRSVRHTFDAYAAQHPATHAGAARFVLRRFYCPSCATQMFVEVNLKDEPPVWTVEVLDP